MQHAQVAIEEQRVDRKAHERRVNRRSGAQEEALAGGQTALAQQPAHTTQRTIGELADAQGLAAREVDYQLGLGH